MGILDQILGAALGGTRSPNAQDQVSQTQVTDMAQAVLAMVNDPRIGGVNGLMEKFQRGGLGEIFQSWIGTGPNQGISNDQLDQILGQQRVQEISQGAGLPAGQGTSILAQLLPLLIDQMTPQGRVPEQSPTAQTQAELLKRLLG